MIEQLYSTHYKELLGWCKAMAQNGQQAEDLVQEAFLRAMKHTALLEHLSEAQRVSWMYRTIRNLYIDSIRHASFETLAENIPEGAADFEADKRIGYEQALMQLSKDERRLFALQCQGYSSKELGRIFGMPPGTVRAKLFSARKKLKSVLTK
ncbi:MAG: RNA polymerase sigma factor [Eubacterium sp.]|nr:RNA polymerase sigma factor [Eubacterium sp.]